MSSLIADIEAACRQHEAIELARRLLERLARCSVRWAMLDEARNEACRKALEATFTEYLRSVGSPNLVAADADRLCARMSSVFANVGVGIPDPMRAALAAHALAAALDNVLGRVLVEEFSDYGWEGRIIKPGDVVPIASPPLLDIYGSLTARPGSREPASIQFEHVRLLPQHAKTFRVRVIWDECDMLGTVGKDLSLASGHLQANLGELSWRNIDGAVPRFFDVRPQNTATNAERARAILEKAEALGASVLVFPELSVTSSDIEVIRTWLRQGQRRLEVVVCGSHHVVVDGKNRNVAVSFIRGRELQHYKFNAFVLSPPKNQPTAPRRREDIITEPAELRIVSNERWSLTVLICKDILATEVARIVSALSVSLVLVPAASASTTEFHSALTGIAIDGQGTVLLANTPSEPQPHRKGTRSSRSAVCLVAGPRPLMPIQIVPDPSSGAPYLVHWRPAAKPRVHPVTS